MRTRQTVPKAGAGVPGARCAPLPPSALSSARAPRWGADPCCPTRVAETPGRRVAEDREAEREKKSPPGTPERRPATPSSPSFSSSHRPADPGPRGKEAAGAGPSARVSAPRPAARGPRGPSRAGSGRAARGGGGGAGCGRRATPPRASRGASSPGGGGRRTCRGLDVDDRAARGGKCLIKPQLCRPDRLSLRCFGSARRWGADPGRTADGPRSQADTRQTPARAGADAPPAGGRRGPRAPRRRGHARPAAWPRRCLRAPRS